MDEAIGQVQFGSPRNYFNSIIFKLDKHVVLLGVNYIMGETVQILVQIKDQFGKFEKLTKLIIVRTLVWDFGLGI